MIVHAELSCMNCGYEVGDVEGERGARFDALIFLPAHQGDTLQVDGRGQVRCPRCQGRVLPHGVTPVKRPLDRNHLAEPRIEQSVTRGMMW